MRADVGKDTDAGCYIHDDGLDLITKVGVPDGVRMLAVPEPATACLLAAGAALLLRRRRREWRERRREAS